MTKKVKILNIPVDALTLQQTLNVITKAIDNRKKILHTCINAGKVVLMQRNPILFESTVNADLVSADGQAIVWAGKLLGQTIPERVAGIDLMEELVKLSKVNKYKIFLLGAREEVVTKMVDLYIKEYGPEIIAGFRNGYFKESEEPAVVAQINASGADILFVAMNSPRKEVFLYQNRENFDNISFLMGVGGSFDVISGKISRAPRWMQNNGLEWLFRLIKEPKKMWRRYLVGNTKFVLMVVKAWLKSIFAR